ncbi:MAG: GNAT family N-acetyltransferase [Acidobacteriaceae bacterium]
MTTIRWARPEDAALILEFVRELAEYEREPDAVTIREDELLRDGFPAEGGERYFECLIAEEDEESPHAAEAGARGSRREAAGFALFFPVYSTWKGRAMHLEDLFVRPRFRGRGIGKALLTKVAAVAVERGCARFFWHVLDWNTPAIEFYQSLGAAPLTDWTRMEISGEALRALATEVQA